MSYQSIKQNVCGGWGHIWVTYGDPNTNTVDTRCSNCDLLMELTETEVREVVAASEELALEPAFNRWLRAHEKQLVLETRHRIVGLLEELKRAPQTDPDDELWNFAIEDAVRTIEREVR